MQKFVLVEHSLQNLGGHYYTYAYSVLEAAEAAGYRPILAANRRFQDLHEVPTQWQVHALFPDKSRWTLTPDATNEPGAAPAWRTWLSTRLRERRRLRIARRFAAAAAALFRRVALEAGDHVFVASASDADLLGLAMFLHDCPATRCATWHVQFHHPLFHGREPDLALQAHVAHAARAAFGDALRRVPHHRVRLHCTTPQLARQYQYLDVAPFEPLPYAIHSLFRGPAGARAGNPIRIACLGHTRAEKGYDQLPQVIRALWPTYLSSGRGELLLQTRRRKLRKRLASLVRELGARTDSQGLAYAPFPLDLPQYAQLVRSTDVNLLLYDSTRYYSRCSGVLLESLVAGVPVIVPAGGWLAEQIDEPNQLYLELLAQRIGPSQGRTEVGTLRFSAAVVVTPFAASTDARQVLLEFRWSAPKGHGTYARLTLQHAARDSAVAEFTVIVGGREDGLTRVLFNLPPQQDRLQVSWANAYGDAPIELADVRIAPLTGARHPIAGIGLTAAHPQQSPLLVEEILENLEHYQRAARALCPNFAARYSADAVVAICTERASTNESEAPARRLDTL